MKLKYTLAALAATTLAANAATYTLYDGTLAVNGSPIGQGWTAEGAESDSAAITGVGWNIDDNNGDIPRYNISLTGAQLSDLVANGGTITMEVAAGATGGFVSMGVNHDGAGLFGSTAGNNRAGFTPAVGTNTWTFGAGTIAPGWNNGAFGGYTGAADQLQVQFESGSSGGTNADFTVTNVTLTTVPEPSSAALLGLGGLALILRRRK